MMRIRAGPVMQLDDTPVMCQGGRGESNFQAYLWAFVNPEVDGVAFRFTSGRASELLAAELGDFAGTLVVDGYRIATHHSRRLLRVVRSVLYRMAASTAAPGIAGPDCKAE
jgi:hypothetical protein